MQNIGKHLYLSLWSLMKLGMPQPLLIGGMLFGSLNLVGYHLFSATVAFQLITLLVKFNASSRAKSQIIYDGIIRNGEERGVNKVL